VDGGKKSDGEWMEKNLMGNGWKQICRGMDGEKICRGMDGEKICRGMDGRNN